MSRDLEPGRMRRVVLGGGFCGGMERELKLPVVGDWDDFEVGMSDEGSVGEPPVGALSI